MNSESFKSYNTALSLLDFAKETDQISMEPLLFRISYARKISPGGGQASVFKQRNEKKKKTTAPSLQVRITRLLLYLPERYESLLSSA